MKANYFPLVVHDKTQDILIQEFHNLKIIIIIIKMTPLENMIFMFTAAGVLVLGEETKGDARSRGANLLDGHWPDGWW